MGHTGTSDRRWLRIAALVAVSVALAIVAGLALGAQRSDQAAIDQERATMIARDFFDHAHGTGAGVANVKVMSIAPGSDAAGHSVWKINISGDVIEPGRTSPSGTSYMWLYVDAASGAVAIFAQG